MKCWKSTVTPCFKRTIIKLLILAQQVLLCDTSVGLQGLLSILFVSLLSNSLNPFVYAIVTLSLWFLPWLGRDEGVRANGTRPAINSSKCIIILHIERKIEGVFFRNFLCCMCVCVFLLLLLLSEVMEKDRRGRFYQHKYAQDEKQKLFLANGIRQRTSNFGKQRIKLTNFTLHIRQISSA
jgi:hypothetical protein